MPKSLPEKIERKMNSFGGI